LSGAQASPYWRTHPERVNGIDPIGYRLPPQSDS
jgi:hypothetical protein